MFKDFRNNLRPRRLVLLILMAVPKQPQSGTRSYKASNKVVMVKNSISMEAPSTANRENTLVIKQMPTINSAKIINMANAKATSLSQVMP